MSDKAPLPEGKKRLLELASIISSAYPKKGVIGTNEEMEWAISWMRSVPRSDPNFANNNAWNQDLIRLGINHPLGPLNRKHTEKIARFIWARLGQEEPDFEKLLAYVDAERASQKALVAHKFNALKKKKKIERKQKKIKRRKGRR